MKGRVLVADDNGNDRIIAETLLRARGLSVWTVGDGIEALEMAGRLEPHVVIVDPALPGMNGWELVRRLRGRFEPMPLSNPPAIVVSSSNLEAATTSFLLRLGADAVLDKPVNPKAMLDTVAQLVADRVALRAAG